MTERRNRPFSNPHRDTNYKLEKILQNVEKDKLPPALAEAARKYHAYLTQLGISDTQITYSENPKIVAARELLAKVYSGATGSLSSSLLSQVQLSSEQNPLDSQKTGQAIFGDWSSRSQIRFEGLVRSNQQLLAYLGLNLVSKEGKVYLNGLRQPEPFIPPTSPISFNDAAATARGIEDTYEQTREMGLRITHPWIRDLLAHPRVTLKLDDNSIFAYAYPEALDKTLSTDARKLPSSLKHPLIFKLFETINYAKNRLPGVLVVWEEYANLLREQQVE